MNARSRARRKSRRAPEPRTVRVAPRGGHALAGRRPGGAGLFHVRAVPRCGVRAGHRCGPGTAARSLRVGFPERAWPWAASLGRPSVATLSSRFSAPWLAVAGAGGQSSARADLVRRVLRGKNVDKRVGTRSRLLFGGGADAAGLAARPAAGASSRSGLGLPAAAEPPAPPLCFLADPGEGGAGGGLEPRVPPHLSLIHISEPTRPY